MRKGKIIGGIVLGATVLTLIAVVLIRSISPGGAGRDSDGSIYKGSPAVGVIEINGAIAGGESSASLFGGGYTGSQTVMAQLRQVSKEPNIKAVVLHMNSPGGTPAASQEIADEVLRLKKSGVKIVTSMSDVAASGAYWIAATSDRIVANPGTITGSIGVIVQTKNYQGLYNKLGIEGNTFKSGIYKDMGTTDRPVTEEEGQIFQSMVEDTYQQFIDIVAKNRKLNPQDVRQLNGRVMTGRQAVNAGLVDTLGNFYDAVSIAGEMAGLGKTPEVIDLGSKKQWWQAFESLQSAAGITQAPLSSLDYSGVLLLCPPIEMLQ